MPVSGVKWPSLTDRQSVIQSAASALMVAIPTCLAVCAAAAIALCLSSSVVAEPERESARVHPTRRLEDFRSDLTKLKDLFGPGRVVTKYENVWRNSLQG